MNYNLLFGARKAGPDIFEARGAQQVDAQADYDKIQGKVDEDSGAVIVGLA